MFFGTKKNQEKIEEIRQAPEILRVDAQYARGEGALKLFLLLLVALLIVYYKDVFDMFREKTSAQQIILSGMFLFFVAALILTLYMMKRRRGKALVVTERGLFVEASFAQFWQDIEEYRWNDAPDLNNLLSSGPKRGASLLLVNNKGAWPKIYDLALQGFFFTPQQIQRVDDLCRHLEIKKSQG